LAKARLYGATTAAAIFRLVDRGDTREKALGIIVGWTPWESTRDVAASVGRWA
jgi:hypothetical protein